MLAASSETQRREDHPRTFFVGGQSPGGPSYPRNSVRCFPLTTHPGRAPWAMREAVGEVLPGGRVHPPVRDCLPVHPEVGLLTGQDQDSRHAIGRR